MSVCPIDFIVVISAADCFRVTDLKSVQGDPGEELLCDRNDLYVSDRSDDKSVKSV